MKGDFSRDTYRPASQYSRVLAQMGRVQIDSDWNEQTSILLGYMRALTRDLFGLAAGPGDDCGFRIVTSESLKTLPQDVQKRLADELGTKALDPEDLLIMPGRYYVGGLPVEAAQAVRYRDQLGFPFGGNAAESLRQRTWLAYLDVWEDFVSAEQDPYIRETALNGVDTCGRAQIRWQVRVAFNPELDTAPLMPPTGSGRIRVRANPTEEQDELCSIEPDARYRGSENQLYRVEIHAGGQAAANTAGATFKWSRDNGSTTFRIRSGNGKRILLAHLGRDESTTLVEGDWVELVDDALVAATGVGLLAQVTKVDRDDFEVELAVAEGSSPLTTYDEAQARTRRAFLRRWDHRGDPKRGGAIPVAEGAEFELEDGIKVTFDQGGKYRPGDYWMIPARVLTGEVEWPGGPDNPEFQLPHGPAHYYAPLAGQVHKAGKPPEFRDLRCCIARMACMPQTAATGKTPPNPNT